MIEARPEWLAATRSLDFEHPAVRRFIAEAIGEAAGDRKRAVRLYYAVRDRIRYDPYRFRIEEDAFAASTTVLAGAAYCVPKALLYAACLRGVGIPARPGFADVRNHLTTERLLAIAGSDVFSWHGYVAMLLDGAWVKATPAFNIEMCQRFDVLPLDFDGIHDALLHPYNALRQPHMEYVRQRGEFDDLPYEVLAAEMRRDYPGLIQAALERSGDDFEREAIHR